MAKSPKMDRDRQLIRDALAYREGPDSVNSMYMGSMATAMVYHAFGLKYGQGDLQAAINAGSRVELDKALKVCAPYIAYMRQHPMTRQVTNKKAHEVVLKLLETVRKYQDDISSSSGLDLYAEALRLLGLRQMDLDK